MDGALSLGLGAWRRDQRRRHLSNMGYARVVDNLWHRDISVASRQRHGRQKSKGRGSVSGVMWHI
jgi:hypothetical protein